MIKPTLQYIVIVGYFLHVNGLTKRNLKSKDTIRGITPEKAGEEPISHSGAIALIVSAIIAILALIYCLVNRYCLNKRETAVVIIGNQRVCETAEFSCSNDSPPPPYPGITASESTPPPRYSTLFDEQGRERVEPPSLV